MKCRLENVIGFSGEQLFGKQSEDHVLINWKDDTASRFAPLTVGGKAKLLADGKIVVSASKGFVRIWDSQGGSLVSIVKLKGVRLSFVTRQTISARAV